MKKNNTLDIDRIAFIGRTFDEYMSMFGLDENILKHGPVLDCPAGSASFTAEADQLGYDVTACDILYKLSVDKLLEKGKKDIQHIYEKLNDALHLYKWEYYKNKYELIALRNKALGLFVDDFTDGYRKGRYRYAELPHLPFPDKTFSHVLSSHFLFLYGDKLSPDFHKACLKELVRVSYGEVRVYPLTGLDAKPCAYLNEVLAFLHSEKIEVDIVEVPFEFQIGSNKMMRLSRNDGGRRL